MAEPRWDAELRSYLIDLVKAEKSLVWRAFIVDVIMVALSAALTISAFVNNSWLLCFVFAASGAYGVWMVIADWRARSVPDQILRQLDELNGEDTTGDAERDRT